MHAYISTQTDCLLTVYQAAASSITIMYIFINVIKFKHLSLSDLIIKALACVSAKTIN